MIDHASIEWSTVVAARYGIRQTLRYEYDEPISDLRHRLIVAPRAHHLDQRRLTHCLWSTPGGALALDVDDFGNAVASVAIEAVEHAITFELTSEIVRDRRVCVDAHAGNPRDPRWRAVGRLTRADEPLTAIAAGLRAVYPSERARAHAIMRFVHHEMIYTKNVTDVFTTAATAFRMHRGVCQDFAHIAIALARAGGLGARYTSGHLLGEGATHAWVEFMILDEGAPVVLALDPTYNSPVDLRYTVVAIGRDYEDVAPTSGVFRGTTSGTLHGTQHVALLDVTRAA